MQTANTQDASTRKDNTINFNVADPTSDSSLHGMVVSMYGKDALKFGATRAALKSVRGDHNSLINRLLGQVNKERKAQVPALAPVTSYDVVTALANRKEDGFKLSFQPDTLYAFGRKLANTVGYDNHLALDDIKDCLSYLTVQYIEDKGNSYLSLADFLESDQIEADGELIPDGATPVPAEMQSTAQPA